MEIFISFLMEHMVLVVFTGIAVAGLIGLGITLAVLSARDKKRRRAEKQED